MKNTVGKITVGPIICTFAFSYLLFMHITLPTLKRKDLFIFSRWSLFSGPPEQIVFDYSWDGGKTFLLRDYKVEEYVSRRALLYTTMKGDINKVKKKYSKYLLQMANGRPVSLYKLKGTLAQHAIKKEKLEPLAVTKVTE